MKNEKGFADVFASDTLPKKIKTFENGVINLDVSTGPGTHWVCYYNDPKYNFIEYFDPFGEYKYNNKKIEKEYIPRKIKNFLKFSNKKPKIGHNDSFIKKSTSVKCGLFCMKYIRERNKGKSPVEILTSVFTEYPNDYNEKLVLNK